MVNSRTKATLIWVSISAMGLGIMKLLLVVLALLSAPSPSKLDTRGLEGYLRFPGMEDVSVVWRDCGHINAFWDRKATIIMCNELHELAPGAQRFFLAHEWSHAIIDRLHIPYTGSEETAADELAAVSMLILGYEDDIYEMEKRWWSTREWLDPFDTHLHGTQRAWNLTCLRWGSKNNNIAGCADKWASAVNSWSKLISYANKN